MSKSNIWEAGLLNLVFNNISFANVGDAIGLVHSTTEGFLYVALHTADPGEAGDQTTNETSYTGYARVPVVRSSAGWTVSGTAPTQVTNAITINFGLCTGGSPTITHFSIGTAVSGADTMLYSGPMVAPLAVSNGIAPNYAVGDLQITED